MQRVAGLEPSRAAHAGDAAFTELLRPLIEPAFRLAFAILHDAATAEDVVQDAAFTAWSKLPGMKDQGRLRPWFFGIVANKCRNARRNRWRSRVDLGVPDELQTGSREEQTLRGADLRRAIARLSYDERLVVVLFFYLDMPLVEVAAAADSSVAATRARLYRAIKRLRPDLDIQEALT